MSRHITIIFITAGAFMVSPSLNSIPEWIHGLLIVAYVLSGYIAGFVAKGADYE